MKYYQTTNNNSLSLANAKVNNSKVFNLSMKSQVKPTSVQDRLLRRIIEKRLAQVNHRISKVIVPEDLELQKTVDIHPPKTGISVHFSDSFILVALQI